MKKKITKKSIAAAVAAATALQGTTMVNDFFNVAAFAEDFSWAHSVEHR